MPDTILLTNDQEKRWEHLARCLHRIETRQMEAVRTTDNLAAEIRSLVNMQKTDRADLLALAQPEGERQSVARNVGKRRNKSVDR